MQIGIGMKPNICYECNNETFPTTRQLSKKTLLPVTTVHNRIRKLKEERGEG